MDSNQFFYWKQWTTENNLKSSAIRFDPELNFQRTSRLSLRKTPHDRETREFALKTWSKRGHLTIFSSDPCRFRGIKFDFCTSICSNSWLIEPKRGYFDSCPLSSLECAPQFLQTGN